MRTRKCYNMEKDDFTSKILGGVFIIGFGVLVLLSQIGFAIPEQLLSWEMILILVGIVSLVKHKFKKMFGLVLLVIGGIFMINDFYPYVIETRFIWPVLIIVFGVSIFFKAFKTKKKDVSYTILEDSPASESNEDFVNSTAFFGGVNKTVVSKNFKGAKISSVFGGTELNLTHADFENQAVIEISCVFGGINIIVPSHWKVHTEMTTMFGGIDDKRPVHLIDENSGKMLILKGNCAFGGVEIASYA